jgi:hypothetical protein
MSKLLLWAIAVAALPGWAQNIAGSWQGTLKAGPQELRIVMKISRADDESLKAAVYSIDQAGAAFSAGAVTLRGSALKMTIPAISAAYEGTLSSDGKSIAGTWLAQPPRLRGLFRNRRLRRSRWQRMRIRELKSPPSS